jgi:transglutaminase-like putative cysteine protease
MMATAWELFGQSEPGAARVQAICDWVHDNITFQYGTSNPLTTAVDVFNNRKGVCRDLTHLAVTFCRALNLPSRYVFGYLPDLYVPVDTAPMDFAAWMEVWLGDRWWTFDPRNNQRRVGRVLIGRGRDALDVAMITTFGPAAFKSMKVWADTAEAA